MKQGVATATPYYTMTLPLNKVFITLLLLPLLFSQAHSTCLG